MPHSPEWIEAGRWAFPRPGAGEDPLYCWVIDGCPYVLIAMVLSYGEIYRLRVYGYDPADARDEWGADSNASFAQLQEQVGQEMQRLATSWSGRLRKVDLRDAANWHRTMKAALADGITQIVPLPEDDAPSQIPA